MRLYVNIIRDMKTRRNSLDFCIEMKICFHFHFGIADLPSFSHVVLGIPLIYRTRFYKLQSAFLFSFFFIQKKSKRSCLYMVTVSMLSRKDIICVFLPLFSILIPFSTLFISLSPSISFSLSLSLSPSLPLSLSFSLFIFFFLPVNHSYTLHTHTHSYIYIYVLAKEGKEFANGPGDQGLILGWVIQKTRKMVLDATLINTQHYTVRVKSKVKQSRERSSAFPYTSM